MSNQRSPIPALSPSLLCRERNDPALEQIYDTVSVGGHSQGQGQGRTRLGDQIYDSRHNHQQQHQQPVYNI